MKYAVFWDVKQREFIINQSFRRKFCLHLQGRRNNASMGRFYSLTLFLGRFLSFNLKIVAGCSSETFVHNKPTRRHIPEDGILQSHDRENLKSCYIVLTVSQEHVQKGAGHAMQ
jgi:hypothetical protein